MLKKKPTILLFNLAVLQEVEAALHGRDNLVERARRPSLELVTGGEECVSLLGRHTHYTGLVGVCLLGLLGCKHLGVGLQVKENVSSSSHNG